MFVETDMIKFILLWILCIHQAQSLYEDQVGKFDWKQRYLGGIKFSHIDSRQNSKRIYVASSENVVAALSLNTGNIIWRQVLEKSTDSNVDFFYVDVNSVVTVSRNGLVRVWNPNEGSLLSEWAIPSHLNSPKFIVEGGNFYAIELSVANRIIQVHTFKLFSGTLNDVVRKVSTPWLSESTSCIINEKYLACLNQDKSLKVFNPLELQPKFLDHQVTKDGLLSSVSSASDIPSFRIGNTIVTVKDKQLHTSEAPCDTLFVEKDSSDTILFVCVKSGSKTSIDINTLVSSKVLSSSTLQLKTQIAPTINLLSCYCKGTSPSCFCIMSSNDHTALFCSSQGKVVWTREESLANIISAEFLDLPVSDADAAIEKEFDNQESGYIDMFLRRIGSQLDQLQSLFSFESPAFKSSTSLVRDKFGLHKMILAVTSTGKVFAIDNLSGKVLWTLYLPNVTPYSLNGKLSIPIFVQRSTRYIPYPSQVSLLFKDKFTKEGVLFTLDPVLGKLTPEQGKRLGYQVSLSILLPGITKTYLKGILLLDTNNIAHLEPPSTPVQKPYYLYKVDSKLGALTGYSLEDNLQLTKIWELNFCQPVINVACKNPLEKVHSQGRVLYDRSVLYKYTNPNLVAVATNSSDSVTSIYLVDVVSGSIIDSIVHKRTFAPFHMVHSENWLVYVYFNERTRRNEVTTVEMYEGKVQSNSSAFSSLVRSPFKPLLDKQSYILPVSHVHTIKETITEKGITSKHILFALGTGGILEVPWVLLDPRRPTTVTPEMREEGQVVIEYAPELPILSESIINYNQTLYRIRDIHTAPSGLESTCFVFSYGLDLFYTRVAPSKTFDMLKEDFDYLFICLVLGALIMGAVISKRFSSKKMLKQAWK